MLKRLFCFFCMAICLIAWRPASAQDRTDKEDRPLIFINQDRLARLKDLSQARTAQWRRLYWWSQEPARRKATTQDGPGLALTALILQDTRPDKAKSVGALAVACALKAARYGIVGDFSDTRLRMPLPADAADEFGPHRYRFLNPNDSQDRIFPIAGLYERGVSVDPKGPSLKSAARKGGTYLLLLDNLKKAAPLVGDVALTLNWAWNHFTPGQRRGVAAWLVNQAGVFKDQGRGCFDSASMAALRLTALAGLAARGLHPKAEELLNQALETRFDREILPCLLGAGQGGAWFEGDIAGTQAGLDLLQFVAAVKTANGLDLLSTAPWFKDRLVYLIFNLLPETKQGQNGSYRPVCPGGDALLSPERAADAMRLQMLLLSNLDPQGQAAGWARSFIFDQKAPQVLAKHLSAYEFLWLEPATPEAPLSAAPLRWLASGTGRAFLRSDWSDLATWLKFSCGPHFAEAQHLDAASLMLYRRGFLMPAGGAFDGSATPHALNYAIRSVAQNTILIRDKEEYSWYDMRAGFKPRGAYANDGGQKSWATFGEDGRPAETAPWTASGWDTGPAPYKQLGKVYQVASIEAFDQRPRFAYLRGNAGKAYQGSTHKAKRVVRHVFHLLPNGPQDFEAVEAVVVVDDVVVKRQNAQVVFATHFPSRPHVSADLKTAGPGRFTAQADRLRVVLSPSRLDVICLWPQNSRLRLFGQKGEAACWVDGKNYPPRPGAKNPAPWRAEFGAEAARGENRSMVHVLLPADENSSPPPEVKRISAPDPDTVGLVIHDPLWPRVVVVRLGRPEAARPVVYSFPVGRSRHVIAGLLPNHSYTVQYSPGKIQLNSGPGLSTSEAGVLSFLVVPPGKNQQPATAPPNTINGPKPE